MKKLVLVRHAKSSWEFDLPDEERPLKKRGFNDAKIVSEAFAKQNIHPDKIYSSPANRALSTCKIFMKAMKIPEDSVQIKERLYDFGGSNVIDIVKSMSNDYDTVMIFGHNHAFTSIANIYGNSFIDNLPTSGLVVLEFDINNWMDLKPGTTFLTLFPRDFKS